MKKKTKKKVKTAKRVVCLYLGKKNIEFAKKYGKVNFGSMSAMLDDYLDMTRSRSN